MRTKVKLKVTRNRFNELMFDSPFVNTAGLADKMNMTYQGLCKIARGNTTTPKTAHTISTMLGMKHSELFEVV